MNRDQISPMLFFELLQVAIGNRKMLTHAPTTEEWRELYLLAQRQTLVGIAFRGVEQLPAEQRPAKALLMQWMMATERIKALNADLDRKALAVANKFLEEGFPGVILKGQGVARLYRVERIENSKLKIENGRPDVNDTNDNDTILNNAKKLSPEPIARSVRSAQDDNSDDVNRDCRSDDELSIANYQLSIKEYRMPGDVDIWLYGERKDILRYVRRHVPNCKPVYHHVDFPVIKGLDIEVHFTPSWMNSPVTNRRLQRFFRSFNFVVNSDLESEVGGERGFENPQLNSSGLQIRSDETIQKELSPFKGDERREQSERSGGGRGFFRSFNSQTVPLFIEGRAEQCGAEGVTSVARRQSYSELPSPPLAFNRVYILVHIYRHLFHEGIGLRQLLDYYFVLYQGFTEKEREATMRTLRSLKMQRFTAAVMWVLQEVYGMDDRYLLTTPDEREGRFLLGEIMLAGNFGQYDERMQHERGESALHWGLRKVRRNFRFVRSYPSEVLWSPLFKLWHYFWRKSR